MNWTEEDKMKSTVNDISNITFIEQKHACWSELLKNAVTDASPPVGNQSDEAAPLALHDGNWLEIH